MHKALIVNFNSSADCAQCIASLKRDGVHDIWVLDNKSSPEEHALIVELSREHDFKLVESESNIGFGAGVNALFSASHPEDREIIQIVNPDLTVKPGAIAEISKLIDSGLADVVSPQVSLTPSQSGRIWHCGGRMSWPLVQSIHLRDSPTAIELSTGIRRCDFLPGAHLAMRASTFRALGGFDEKYFLYWEDADLCARANELGMKLACAVRAVAIHRVGGSQRETNGKSPLFYFFLQRNRYLISKQKFSRWRVLLGTPILYTLALLLWAAKPARGWGNRVKFSIQGISRGFRGHLGLPKIVSDYLLAMSR